jgi:hypothetical protein
MRLLTSLAFFSTKSNDPWNSEVEMKLIQFWLFLQGTAAACGHLGVAFTNNLDRYTTRDLYPSGSQEDHLDNVLPVLTYIPTWNCAETTVRLGGRVLVCSLAKRLSGRRKITINVYVLFISAKRISVLIFKIKCYVTINSMQTASCSLLVSVYGYRSRGLGSIPGATIFSEKVVGPEWGHSGSWVQLSNYLKKKKKGSSYGLVIEITAAGDPSRWLHDSPLSTNVDTNFVYKRRSLGRYSSLAD